MKKFLKYFISAIIGLAISLTLIGVWGVFGNELSLVDKMRVTCDAFFIVAALLLCSAALVWLSKEGAFNGLSFCFKQLFDIHKVSNKDWHSKETYAEYKERVAEKVKSREYIFLVYVGLVFLLVSVIFLVLYHTI